MTPEAIEELIAQRVAEALANYEATRAANALEVKNQSQNGNDGDNGNGRNGNGNHGDGGNNGNRNPNENGRGVMPVAHVCNLVIDFGEVSIVLNSKGNEGVVVRGILNWELVTVDGTMLERSCGKIGHMTRDFKPTVPTTVNQRASVVNQRIFTCFECGRQGHFKKDCPKRMISEPLKQGCYSEVRGKAIILLVENAKPGNPTLSRVTVSILNGPDISYAVVKPPKGLPKINTMLRGCTIGLLGHPFNIDLMPVELDNLEESEGEWNTSKIQDTCDSELMKETKAYTFHRMETREVCEKYITPCFVEGLDAFDGITDLEYNKNYVCNELCIKLGLTYTLKENGAKSINKKLLISLKGETFLLDFVLNPEKDDCEPSVILGRPFLRLAKAIIDFQSGILTTCPNTTHFDSDDELDALLASITVDDLPQFENTDPLTFPNYIFMMDDGVRNIMMDMVIINDDYGSGRRKNMGIMICVGEEFLDLEMGKKKEHGKRKFEEEREIFIFFEFLRLIPSCFVIFDLWPLSLSFDFIFSSEIFKSFPCMP
ncbi:reverse transcriptase domain-containing protein [Tanacetum coccineum]